ncbi:MAG: flagellar motor protein MotB [Pseudomonadota bacterium]
MSNTARAEAQPIIIKKKKVVHGDGHHGGAWKVAYADFVTAMMAFFLLMWLLNATTEQQRKGIADYFNPSIPISRVSGGGTDGLNGSSMFTEQTYANMGTGATQNRKVGSAGAENSPENNDESVTASLQQLTENLQESEGKLTEHLMVKLSPEGIILELVDSEDTPLFPLGTSQPSTLLNDLLTAVSDTFDLFDNNIKIVGHTDGTKFKRSESYNNWDLSVDRANTARRMLESKGISAGRLREVSGKADTEPLIPNDPLAPQNRRISLVILTN